MRKQEIIYPGLPGTNFSDFLPGKSGNIVWDQSI